MTTFAANVERATVDDFIGLEIFNSHNNITYQVLRGENSFWLTWQIVKRQTKLSIENIENGAKYSMSLADTKEKVIAGTSTIIGYNPFMLYCATCDSLREDESDYICYKCRYHSGQ